jgi:hypothetical protein
LSGNKEVLLLCFQAYSIFILTKNTAIVTAEIAAQLLTKQHTKPSGSSRRGKLFHTTTTFKLSTKQWNQKSPDGHQEIFQKQI